MSTLLDRLAALSATFDEGRPVRLSPPEMVDCWARNEHGDVIDLDAEETALVVNSLPLLLAVAKAGVDRVNGIRLMATANNDAGVEVAKAILLHADESMTAAVRAIREAT